MRNVRHDDGERMSGSLPERDENSAAQRWLARGSLAAGVAAAVVVLAAAGVAAAGLLILLVVAEALLVVAGLWIALAHRGPARGGGVALVVAALAGALGIEGGRGLLLGGGGGGAVLAAAGVNGGG